MRTVICNFYNEEYLLPFWLRHHRNLFDHGIMINHHSDDNSVAIIKELVPTWTIVDTKLEWFATAENDKELMSYERSIVDWKITLNLPEFLLPAIPMDEILAYMENNNLDMGRALGYELVDENIADIPKVEESLLLQKHFGCLDFRDGRNRIFHRKEDGNYHLGRHVTRYGSQKTIPNLFLFHYDYSPWIEPYIKRKLQIQNRIPRSDYNAGIGRRHFYDMNQHNTAFQDMIQRSHDLSKDTEIKKALDLIKTYY